MNQFTLLILTLFNVTLYHLVTAATRTVVRTKSKGYIGSNDQFKYQVSVQRNGAHRCGGSILGDKYVISAAQCVYDFVAGEFDEGRLTVIAAINNLQALTETAETTFVQRIYMPRSYAMANDDQPFKGDIIVLQTKHSFGLFNKNKLMKLTLIDNANIMSTDTLVTTGFGYDVDIDTGDSRSAKNPLGLQKPQGKLRLIKSSIHLNSNCGKVYEGLIEPSNLCTVTQVDAKRSCDGACKGDAGSPLVYNETVLFGVLIAGSMDCSCSDQPLVYSNVFYYMSFIKHALMDKRTPNIVVATWMKRADSTYGYVES